METDKTIEAAKQEIREAQLERGSLMRWKLILVSAIGAAALGFSQENQLTNSELALCLIPFACLYVDILCRNLSLRTKMISLFLHEKQDPMEVFYWKYKKVGGSSLESFALRYSTIGLSVLIIPVGIIAYFNDLLDPASWINWTSVLFYISGFLGVAVSVFIEREYKRQKKELEKIATGAQSDNKTKKQQGTMTRK